MSCLQRACQALETDIVAAKAQSPAAASSDSEGPAAAAADDSEGDDVGGSDVGGNLDTTAGMAIGDTQTGPLPCEAAPSATADGEESVTPPEQMAAANGCASTRRSDVVSGRLE